MLCPTLNGLRYWQNHRVERLPESLFFKGQVVRHQQVEQLFGGRVLVFLKIKQYKVKGKKECVSYSKNKLCFVTFVSPFYVCSLSESRYIKCISYCVMIKAILFQCSDDHLEIIASFSAKDAIIFKSTIYKIVQYIYPFQNFL